MHFVAKVKHELRRRVMEALMEVKQWPEKVNAFDRHHLPARDNSIGICRQASKKQTLTYPANGIKNKKLKKWQMLPARTNR